MLNLSIGYGEVILGVGLLGIIQGALIFWLKAYLKNFLTAVNQSQLANYQQELFKQLESPVKTEPSLQQEMILEQASRLASLLSYVRAAEDIRHPDFLKMAWELSLWLPADIYAKLRNCNFGLCSDDEIKEVLLATRRYFLQETTTTMRKENIPPLER